MAQRAFRQKQKDKCSQDKTPSTDPEPKIPKPQTTPNPQKTSKKHDSGSLKKQKAVLRTQRWCMRLKLKMAGKPKSSKLRQAGKNNDSECVSADDEAISSTENQIETASNSNDKATGQTPFRSRSTEWRSTQKAKKALPNTPRRKAKVIENLMNIPDVKKNLESKGVINSEKARKQLKMGMTALNNIKSKLKELKIKRGTAEKERQNTYKKIYHAVVGESKYNLGSALTSYLGLNRKRRPKSPERPPLERRRKDWWKDVPRNPRKDKTSSQIKDQVHGFFLSPDVSREVPNKKDVLKVNGESVNRHVMTMTMQEAHEKFCKENKEIKIGLTAFKKLKPAQVRRVSETSHKSCLCQICCNLSLKIEALQKFALEKENEGLKSEVKNWNKTRLGDIILCEYQNYPKLECLNRSCQHCTVKSLSEKVKDTISDHHDDIITYYEWKPITVESENGSKRVTSCVKENCSMKDFDIFC
ncbi:hypothetical protein FSP39_008135 [Pinctada imbricata]|uniref:Uncharacterized protein n=1 Tax=Pinctada imbricata TaxID=66713 RepID=A0AA88XXV8_PINIB|nr:hypothetical protein FSP39_008135 [Pinctada imbricata]